MTTEKPSTKHSIKAVLKEFSQNTTAHGISQVHIANDWFWRVLWILACGAGIGVVVWQGTKLIITYSHMPQKTKIDVTYSQTVNFPMVTICNLNSIKISKLKTFPKIDEMVRKYNLVQNSNESLKASNFISDDDEMKKTMKKGIMTDDNKNDAVSDVEMDGNEYVKENILNLIAGEDRQRLQEAGHPFEELVFRCSWMGFTCNKGDFKQYWRQNWNWRYGNCYTFNAGTNDNGTVLPVMSTTKPGPLFGLTLDLFINQKEYFGLLSQEAGVKILLTDQHQIPFPTNQGFTVAPGVSSSIGVRKYIIERIDPHDNNSCYAAKEVEEGSIYKHIKGVKYSVQGCMNSCLANKQRERCNCTEGKYKTPTEDNDVCMSEEQVDCKIDVIQSYQNNSLGCARNCSQPCQHSSYRVSVSTALWSDSYEKDFQREITKDNRQLDNNLMGKDSSMMKKNFLRAKIYFDELNLEKITYSTYYQIEDLLSDIGGQLGLWVGVSALTILEIVKLMLDLIKCLAKKLLLLNERKEVGVENIAM